MNMDRGWKLLDKGVLLWPGDEVLTEGGTWVQFRVEWGWTVPESFRYRRREYQQVNVPWIVSKVEHVRAKLKTELARQKLDYRVQAIWTSFADNMQLILDNTDRIADIEAENVELAERIDDVRLEIDSIQTA